MGACMQAELQNRERGIGADMFFLQSLLVSPNRFRPYNELNGMKMEHEHNVLYNKILSCCLDINDLRDKLSVPAVLARINKPGPFRISG
jgi:hypothetical protein